MEAWQYAALTGLGVVAGFLNVMAGGGSLLTMPAMIFLGMPPATANGTNRIAILAQNVAAVGGFRGQGFSDFPLSLALALCTIPGAILGAVVAVRIDPLWFQRILALVMVGVLVTILRPTRKSAGAPAGPRHSKSAYLAMVGLGFYGGFIQAGVGFLLMAVLHTLLRLDLVRVNMHKVFIVGVYTLPAIAVFAWKGQIIWVAAVLLAAGNAVGGWIGSRVSVAKGEGPIRVIFTLAVLGMAVRLFLR